MGGFFWLNGLWVLMLLATPVRTALGQDAPSAEKPAPTSHAERVGWNQKHEVSENIYFKPGSGLTVKSQDGMFVLATRIRGQLRYDLDKADGQPAEQAFAVRRMRLAFTGHWWGEANTYKLELALSPADLGMTPAAGPGSDAEDDNPILSDRGMRVSRSPLLDFYVQFRQLRDLNVRIGQYKIPFSRERVISSGDLMFVDRSIVNREFTLDRDLGFDIRSRDLFGAGGRLHYYAGVFTGEGHSSFANRDVSTVDHFFGLNTLVRVEVLPMGDFEDYAESDLERTPSPKLSVGATFAHIGRAQGQQGILGAEPADDGTTDFLLGEVDALFKFRGFSVQTAFMIRDGKRNDDGTPGVPQTAPRDGWGLTGQASYAFIRKVEIEARHSAIRGKPGGSLPDRNETGAGVSYYLAGHPFKIQMDFFRLYGSSIRDGQYQFRTQLQVSL